MKTLTSKIMKIIEDQSDNIGDGYYDVPVGQIIQAVKERDNEVFGWLYKENPDPKKLPETEEEIEAANNEKFRIAKRMEETI